MKYIALILFILFVKSQIFAQNLNEITSAEERIVYNKNHNLNKYDGILIAYSYKIILKELYEDKDLIERAKPLFSGTIKAEIFEQDGVRYLSILTEGSRENHAASVKLGDLEFKTLEFYKRNYYIK